MRLLLVAANVGRDLDPGLRAARPDVGDRLEPTDVVKCARLERYHVRQAVDFAPEAAAAVPTLPVSFGKAVSRLKGQELWVALQQF